MNNSTTEFRTPSMLSRGQPAPNPCARRFLAAHTRLSARPRRGAVQVGAAADAALVACVLGPRNCTTVSVGGSSIQCPGEHSMFHRGREGIFASRMLLQREAQVCANGGLQTLGWMPVVRRTRRGALGLLARVVSIRDTDFAQMDLHSTAGQPPTLATGRGGDQPPACPGQPWREAYACPVYDAQKQKGGSEARRRVEWDPLMTEALCMRGGEAQD
jgi:hypothetical protein